MAAEIVLLGCKLFCKNCRKKTWFHQRPKGRSVCRGDWSPSDARNGVEAAPGQLGCGVERGIKWP